MARTRKKKPDVERQPGTVTESLKCILTEKEKVDHAASLSDLISKEIELEGRKKSIAKTIGAEIDALKLNYREISTAIQQGYEFRDVECYMEHDYGKGVKHKVRSDTGEVVLTQDLTDFDRQMKIKMDQKKKGSKKDSNDNPPDGKGKDKPVEFTGHVGE